MLNDVLGIPVLNARFSLPKQRSSPYELPEFVTLDTEFNLRILAGLLSVFRLQLKQTFLCNEAFPIIGDLSHLCSLVVHMLFASLTSTDSPCFCCCFILRFSIRLHGMIHFE